MLKPLRAFIYRHLESQLQNHGKEVELPMATRRHWHDKRQSLSKSEAKLESIWGGGCACLVGANLVYIAVLLFLCGCGRIHINSCSSTPRHDMSHTGRCSNKKVVTSGMSHTGSGTHPIELKAMKKWTNYCCDMDIKIHPHAAAMFACSVVSLVGDGSQTCFWTDHWLHGQALSGVAPALISWVPKKILIPELWGMRWFRMVGWMILLDVWNLMQGFQLQPGVPDQHRWTHSASSEYSSRSAYGRFFSGNVLFEPAQRIWKTWAPPRCKSFIWLASLNRCWTADRLARRGLDHPEKCLLCDQEVETIHHILVQCVFAREDWHHILSLIGLQHLTLRNDEIQFQDWWNNSEIAVPKPQRRVSIQLWP